MRKTLRYLWHEKVWLMLAIGVNCVRLYFKQLFPPDIRVQLTGSRALLAGNGYGVPRAAETDLAQVFWQPIIGWPPGTSLIYALPSWLASATTVDYYLIVWLTTCVFVVVYFLSLWVISRHLKQTSGQKWLVAFWVFNALLFSVVGLPNVDDLICLALLTLAVACLLHFLAQSRWHAAGFLAGLCFSLAVITRFAYWPLSAAIPLALVSYTWLKRQRRYGWTAVWFALPVLASIALVYITQARSSGHGTFLSAFFGAGPPTLYWGNLTKMPPFPAFLLGFEANMWVITLLSRFAGAVVDNAYHYFLVVLSIAIFGVVFWACLRRIYQASRQTTRHAAAQPFDAHLYLYVLTPTLFLTTVGGLMFLSVTTPPFFTDPFHNRFVSDWTFVETARYYVPLVPFVQLVVLEQMGRFGRKQQRVWLVAGLCMAAFLFVSQTMRLEIQIRQVQSGNALEHVYLDALTPVAGQHAAAQPPPVFVFLPADGDVRPLQQPAGVAQQYNLRYFAGLLGFVLADPALLTRDALPTTQPVTLIIADNSGCQNRPATLVLPGGVRAQRITDSCKNQVPLTLYQAVVLP